MTTPAAMTATRTAPQPGSSRRIGVGGESVFYVPHLPPPGAFALSGAEGRHAATVRRIRPGEQIVLCDGAGGWAAATVRGTGRDALTVLVGQARTEPAPDLRVTVVQALPKGEHADRAVDLATEAGADAIVPWQASRCVARWDGAADKPGRGRDRWARTAREAAKQSRRRHIPRVHPLATADQVASLIAAADATLMLHEAATDPLGSAVLPGAGELVLVVGPEGGLAPDEVELFAGAGATPVRMGREVLRTSTAAAVALGALGVLTGRWR